MKHLGILGGSGALAAANFYNRFIYRISREKRAINDSEYPNITLLNHPVPYCTEEGLTSEGEPSPNAEVFTALLAGLEKLHASGCDTAVMYCNSVHIFHRLLAKTLGSKMKLLNMVELASDKCGWARRKTYTKVGVIGSQSTRNNGIFRDALQKVKVEEVEASDYEQEVITKLIREAMVNHGGFLNHNPGFDEITEVIRGMSYRGAEACIIGCTELSYLMSHWAPGMVNENVIDSSTVLSDELMNYIR